MKTIVVLLFLSIAYHIQSQELSETELAIAESTNISQEVLKLVRTHTDATFIDIPKDDTHEYAALAINLENEKATALVNELRKIRYMKALSGYTVFKAIRNQNAADDQVRILHQEDPLYPIKYMKTKGSYPKLSTDQIFDKIERWHGRRGCVLLGAGKNWVELQFVLPLEDTDKFAKEIISLCPALDSVYRGYERLSKKLQEEKPTILLEW